MAITTLPFSEPFLSSSGFYGAGRPVTSLSFLPKVLLPSIRLWSCSQLITSNDRWEYCAATDK